MSLDVSGLSDAELLALYEREMAGSGGELPFEIAADRERCLDSPYHLATTVLDPYYQEFFEHRHAVLLDEVLGPWIIGETVTFDGISYEPADFIGLLVLWPRGTFKSSVLRMAVNWAYPYHKIRLGEDLTVMYTHQIHGKAVDHGDGIRSCARFNARWRERFPEFSVDVSQDWDRKDYWRWPHMAAQYRQAALWSFVAYGESSSKIGGHYKLRIADDWETDESVTSPDMILQSERKFRQFDNLKVMGRTHNPWIAVGTYYHYDGPYRRLEKGGGWLTWRVPAHEGSSKAIFDLVSIDTTNEAGRNEVKRGIAALEQTREADLNFPKLYPWRELYRAALGQKSDDDGELHGGLREYSCQILLQPVAAGQSRFDDFALENAWIDDLPAKDEVTLYIRIDPAIGKKKKHSETAIILGAVRWDRHRFVLRTWSGHEPRPTKTLRRAYAWVEAWQADGWRFGNIGIESVAFQETMATQASDGITAVDASELRAGESAEIKKPPCPIVKIARTDQQKEERVLEMDGPIHRRELWFWRRDQGNRKTHLDLCQFPHGRMDRLDALHDLWVHTVTPPRPLGKRRDEWLSPNEILKQFGVTDDRARLTGAAGSVKMTSW